MLYQQNKQKCVFTSSEENYHHLEILFYRFVSVTCAGFSFSVLRLISHYPYLLLDYLGLLLK